MSNQTKNDRRDTCHLNNLTLVILAAGMGSRYGGLKQLDPVGPHGEVLLDYSIHDALQAGFNDTHTGRGVATGTDNCLD